MRELEALRSWPGVWRTGRIGNSDRSSSEDDRERKKLKKKIMAAKEADLIDRLVSGLTSALKQGQSKAVVQRPIKITKFAGKPSKVGDPTIREWLDEVDNYLEQCSIPECDQANVVINHLTGVAREEAKCHGDDIKQDVNALKKLLRRAFGADETVQSLQKALYERNQRDDESLMDFSRSLLRLHDRILEVATGGEKTALKGLRDKALIGQSVAGARNQTVRLELRRLELANPSQTFGEMRDAARELFRDLEGSSRSKRSPQVHRVVTENFG